MNQLKNYITHLEQVTRYLDEEKQKVIDAAIATTNETKFLMQEIKADIIDVKLELDDLKKRPTEPIRHSAVVQTYQQQFYQD